MTLLQVALASHFALVRGDYIGFKMLSDYFKMLSDYEVHLKTTPPGQAWVKELERLSADDADPSELSI